MIGLLLSTYREERSVILKVYSHGVHRECFNITVRSISYSIIRQTGGFQLAMRFDRRCCQGNRCGLFLHCVRSVVVVVSREEDILLFRLRDFGWERGHGMNKHLLDCYVNHVSWLKTET